MATMTIERDGEEIEVYLARDGQVVYGETEEGKEYELTEQERQTGELKLYDEDYFY